MLSSVRQRTLCASLEVCIKLAIRQYNLSPSILFVALNTLVVNICSTSVLVSVLTRVSDGIPPHVQDRRGHYCRSPCHAL